VLSPWHNGPTDPVYAQLYVPSYNLGSLTVRCQGIEDIQWASVIRKV